MEKENINIENMIYEIRGKQVMFDFDLAKLYKCTNGTKDINKAVKRNISRFPEDFYFQLTKDEINSVHLRFQNGTLNNKGNLRGQHIKYLPFAFTEQGVAMLSSVLRTSIATDVSIRIIRAFVALHKYVSNNLIEQKIVNSIVLNNQNDIQNIKSEIKLLQESFKKFEEKKITNEIYFNGQIYDAYSKIVDILNMAKKEIIIIDGYTNKKTLDIISNIRVKITLITKKKSNLKPIDLQKYHKQYHNLTVTYNETFHDRYIIIDNITIYHLGASINYAGSRTFSINILEDSLIKRALIDNINRIIKR